jgi:hypothetical protein
MWTWIAVGLGAFVLISLLIGVAFARVLSALSAASEALEEALEASPIEMSTTSKASSSQPGTFRAPPVQGARLERVSLPRN